MYYFILSLNVTLVLRGERYTDVQLTIVRFYDILKYNRNNQT